jgi:nucleotide-binding universal stress UspA family protein
VAVDFSAGSEAALAWAVDAAIAFDVSLIVLHVVHDPAEAPGSYLPKDGRFDGIERVARQMMDEFLLGALKRLPRFGDVKRVEPRVVVGLPVTRILEVAEREGARLIVMGAQGRTALGDVLLGSKVERVTRLAPVSVTIVKAGAGRAPPEGGE